MSNNTLNTEVNSETLPFSNYLNKLQKSIETEVDTSKFFDSLVSFEFDTANALISYYPVYSVMPLFDNNYLTVFQKKMLFNYRMCSAVSTYLNVASWNIVFDLNKTDEFDFDNSDALLEARVININRISELHIFLVGLKQKDDEAHEISGMKALFLKIDELIDNNDFPAIDDFILSFISLDFSFQFHISLLASTLKMKSSLNNRAKLFENSMLLGSKLMTKEELQLTLQGLE